MVPWQPLLSKGWWWGILAGSRSMMSNSLTRNLDEIKFLVLWGLATIFELVELVDNSTCK